MKSGRAKHTLQHTVTVTSISKNDVSKAKADRASYAREMEAAKSAPGFVIEGAVGDRADGMNGSYARTTESKNRSPSHAKHTCTMETLIPMPISIGRDVCVRNDLAEYEKPEELGHGDRCLGCGSTSCRTSTLDIVR